MGRWYHSYMTTGERESWNDQADRYRQLGDLLRVIAEDHCGIAVDHTTHQRWREIMGLMTEVDNYVDNRIVTGTGTPEELVAELEAFIRFRDRYPHLAPEVVDQQTWQAMKGTATDIISSFLVLRETQTYEDYMAARRTEAEATAGLFAACATDTVREQPAFYGEFMPILERVGVGACFLDSANDLADDYKSGISSLDPRIGYRLRLLGSAFREALPEIGVARHGRVFRELGRAAFIHAGRHLQKAIK